MRYESDCCFSTALVYDDGHAYSSLHHFNHVHRQKHLEHAKAQIAAREQHRLGQVICVYHRKRQSPFALKV